jgi:predicted metal-dependent hydrolase
MASTSDLTVRNPSFRIDDTVPFQWQPANPRFGLFGNAFTFVAIAFERYIVSATRRATDRFTDEAVAAEADAFLRQEAQHARAHRAHAKAMIDRHPGLQATYDAANAAYDELLEREDVEYHLAYVANLEATFTPLFKMVLDNRGPLFEGGDERVGTLLLWHFVEEIEHRSSALIVHRHVTPDPRYRLRQVSKVFAHVSGVFQLVLDGIAENVTAEECGIEPDAIGPRKLHTSEIRARLPLLRRNAPPTMLGHVPGADLRTMAWRLARSQMPRHDPKDEPLPSWVDRWHGAWDADQDVSTYAGVGL